MARGDEGNYFGDVVVAKIGKDSLVSVAAGSVYVKGAD